MIIIFTGGKPRPPKGPPSSNRKKVRIGFCNLKKLKKHEFNWRIYGKGRKVIFDLRVVVGAFLDFGYFIMDDPALPLKLVVNQFESKLINCL